MTASIVLPPDYKPSADEEYMNDMQLEYFRQKLENWKKSIVSQSVDTLEDLRQGGLKQPDEIDRASLETDKSLDLRTKDRIRKLISKIDSALERIEDGTYGYCEETGEPIGIERLEARPVATLSIEAQEKHEHSFIVWHILLKVVSAQKVSCFLPLLTKPLPK